MHFTRSTLSSFNTCYVCAFHCLRDARCNDEQTRTLVKTWSFVCLPVCNVGRERSKHVIPVHTINSILLTLSRQCDTERPSCGNCSKHNAVCDYLDPSTNQTFTGQYVVLSLVALRY